MASVVIAVEGTHERLAVRSENQETARVVSLIPQRMNSQSSVRLNAGVQSMGHSILRQLRSPSTLKTALTTRVRGIFQTVPEGMSVPV